MPKRLVPTLPDSLKDAMPREYMANEAQYWQARDELRREYAGRWVAFHRGQIVAAGDDFVAVMDEAGRTGHPMAYIDLVAEEGGLEFQCRRATFAYDHSYVPTALPQAEVTFRDFAQSRAQTFADTIPDTGSDLSVLPQADGLTLGLLSGPQVPSHLTGVGGHSTPCPLCRAFVRVAGRQFAALVQVMPGQAERLLGREVLNQISVTFDGPSGAVIFQV